MNLAQGRDVPPMLAQQVTSDQGERPMTTIQGETYA